MLLEHSILWSMPPALMKNTTQGTANKVPAWSSCTAWLRFYRHDSMHRYEIQRVPP